MGAEQYRPEPPHTAQPGPTPWPARAAEAAHIAALGVWLGALVLTGIAAAITFPTLRILDPHLPNYAEYPEDHWAIAGGAIMNRVFIASDWIALACAIIAAAGGAAALAPRLTRQPLRHTLFRPLAILRAAATIAALLITLASFALLRPTMNEDLRLFHHAARSGDIAAADAARARFDEAHPRASMILSAQAGLVLIALTLGAYDATRHPTPPTNPRHARNAP
ncbi:MAG: hypothetical protein ACTS3F_10350 [Phycisphaerales bacterium]